MAEVGRCIADVAPVELQGARLHCLPLLESNQPGVSVVVEALAAGLQINPGGLLGTPLLQDLPGFFGRSSTSAPVLAPADRELRPDLAMLVGDD